MSKDKTYLVNIELMEVSVLSKEMADTIQSSIDLLNISYKNHFSDILYDKGVWVDQLNANEQKQVSDIALTRAVSSN